MMPSNAKALFLTGVVSVLLLSVTGRAQVVTATVYGTVQDASGALLPGAEVTLTNEGTGAVRNTLTGDTGEFAFDFVSVGTYTLRIQMPGFKTFVQSGIQLSAGQTVRQSYTLQIGEVSEQITIEGRAPLISTASTEQRETIEAIKVSELPIGRRNLTSLLRLSTGVDTTGGTRGVRINGVGRHGTGISVDGTDANANPEGRGISTYQGQNYIDVMSVDAVAELQVMRRILPADVGEVIGGQVNVISKSGTNQFHGSLFHNYRSHIFNARHPYRQERDPNTGQLRDKNREVFNQFGGSIGGPILPDKAFFFFTYEGYRESIFQQVSATVPTQALRDKILAALPFPETNLILGHMRLPNIPIDEDRGRVIVDRNREQRENHFVIKGDWLVTSGSNLAVTYTRNRPQHMAPRADIGNDRFWSNEQDRLTFQYVFGSAAWTSETRFGYNLIKQNRLDQIFEVFDPNNPSEKLFGGRRLGYFTVDGVFGAPDGELYAQDGTIYSFDQKISRHFGSHSFKFGARYSRTTGFRTNPETPRFRYRNLNDLFANRPREIRPTWGNTKFDSRMYDIAFFVHDDWRVSQALTLNLGLRYNFFSNTTVKPAEGEAFESCICNLAPPSKWAMFDFGDFLPESEPTQHDGWINLAPRLGFAYNLGGQGKTVIRGGFGVLFTPHMPAILRQGVGAKDLSFRTSWTTADIQRLGLKWPMYNDDMAPIAIQDVRNTGIKNVFSLFDPNLQNPYTMNYQLNIQRSLSQDMMLEVGYVGVRGVKFIMHRRFNLPDRITGIKPNPPLNAAGYYVDNSQQMVYNGLQTSLRKRFSRGLSFDLFYTWSKGMATTGGDIGAYYQDAFPDSVQDFFNPNLDRAPTEGHADHRFIADFIYELPRFSDFNPAVQQVLGGWQVSGIIAARSGEPDYVDQSCSFNWHCRPDYVGGNPKFEDWKSRETTVNAIPFAHRPKVYVNPAAFAFVPESSQGVAIRPGNASRSILNGPPTWTVDFSLAKNFRMSWVNESARLQFRWDMFNALNHVNYGGFNSGMGRPDRPSPTFGHINGAGSMRTMQIALRLHF